MSDKKYSLFLEILAGNQGLMAAVNSSKSSINRFVNQAKRDFQGLRSIWQSAAGKLAAIGAGFGAYKLLSESATMQRSLNLMALQAGKTREEARAMKEELENLGVKTGKSPEELERAFKALISLTGSWEAAAASISSVNSAMAVTDANAESLGQTLSVAADAFKIDLAKPQAASELLNKMAALGKGAGGLENIANIFKDIALPASMTGMNAENAMQFIGVITTATKNPEQQRAMSENVLRLFTNLRALGRMRGVKIFDEQGQRRNPMLVLQDIQKVYQDLDDKAKSSLLLKLLNGDARATRPVQTLLETGALNNLDKIGRLLKDAAGTLEKKVPGAIDNTVDQVKRLKNLMERAADAFVDPINKAIAKTIQFGMDKKGLSGADIGGLGIAAMLTGWLGKNVLDRNLPKLFGKMGVKNIGGLGTLGGVAEGKVLQATMGVTPVFIVNWSDGKGAFSFGTSGGKFQEYLGFPAIEGGAAAGAGMAASIAAIAAPVAIALLAGGTIWAIVRREMGLMARENMDAKIQEKIGVNPHLTRDKNAAPADTHVQAINDALAGRDYKIPDLFVKAPAQSTRNDIRIDLYIDEQGKVVSRATGQDVSLKSSVRRGKFNTQAIADNMFAGSDK